MRWEMVEGSRLSFSDEDGTRREGTIGAVEPERSLSWTWWPEGDEGAATDVTWTVDPDGDDSVLTVTEAPAACLRWGVADDAALGAWAAAGLVTA